VSGVAIRARRTVVGISGNSDTAASDDYVLPGGKLDRRMLGRLSAAIGQALALAGFRVTSGAAPHVGLEAVRSAFAVNPLRARHYLRRGGGTRYQRDAPAIVVEGSDYAAMREAFIGELSALVAVGGHSTGPLEESGVVEEIDRARRRGVPVLLLPQAGGTVAAVRDEFLAKVGQHYPALELQSAVVRVNEALAAVAVDDLIRFVKNNLADLVNDVLAALVESPFDAACAKNNNVPTW
jgi:hypothetical protein